MDKQSKIFVTILFAGLIISACITYYRDFVLHDYTVEGTAPTTVE